jgi:hypothetical protein
MMRSNLMQVAGLAVTLAACGGGGSGSGSGRDSNAVTGNGTIGSTLSPGASVDLGACTDGLSAAVVDEHLAVVLDLEQSYHELIACGGMVFLLAQAVVDVVASIVESPSGGLPDGLEREGGLYTATPGGDSNTLMTATFSFGDDYEVGAEGERIEDNLFALKSYLENPSVDIDYTTGELLIRYGARGPLVELLGFGPNPPRPLRLSPSDLRTITREIEKVTLGTAVVVEDERAHSVITYELGSNPVSIGDLLDGASVRFDVITSAAQAHQPVQDMETLAWDVSYADQSRGLNGNIDFVMVGGDFDYQTRFAYRNDTWPEVSVHCLD